MKRKHDAAEGDGDAAQAAVAAKASADRDAKKAKPAEEEILAAKQAAKKNVIELDETIDVEAFFKQDCDGAAQRLLEQTKMRCADLRREFEQSKQTILKELLAEKGNLLNDHGSESTPDAFDVSIKCVAGPYKGHTYALHLDSQKHRSCLIGRSTGRKFRAPNGLSMPKDAELSTTHAQLRLEPDGRVLFTDLDSTNGSFINDESVEPHEPQLLSTTAPSKVYVGGSDLLITFTRRP